MVMLIGMRMLMGNIVRIKTLTNPRDRRRKEGQEEVEENDNFHPYITLYNILHISHRPSS